MKEKNERLHGYGIPSEKIESEKAAGESPVQILRHEELYQRLWYQYAAGTAGVQFQCGMVLTEAYFLPNETLVYNKEAAEAMRIRHVVNYPLLVPVIYRAGAKRPFGHSRISRAYMSLVNSAVRTMKRSEISAEFFSYPQKWVTGLSEDTEISDKWRAIKAAHDSLRLTATEPERRGIHQ